MQFLSPWMLWGLAAMAAPILIHLWQRRQVVPLPFSTLKYLRIVAARTSRSAKLENLLLLLLRCLIFALLALAAARPVVSKKALRLLGGNVQRTTVLIVDRSLSMGYKPGERTRLEVARDEALSVLDSLKPGDEAAVLAADSGTQALIAEPTQDRAAARRALAGVQPGLGTTDFAGALAAARKILAGSRKPVHEVYLFTDNQEGGWRFDPRVVFDEAWKKAEIELVVVRPDEATAVNSAVTTVKINSPLVTEEGRVNGVVTVHNWSGAPLHDLISLRVGGSEVASVPVEGPANQATDVPFEFPMPSNVGGHVARGTARLQGDNLPADDAFFFTVPIHQNPRVVVVEGQDAGPEPLHSGYYLRRALAAGLPDAGTPALPASALEDAPLTGYSAVFLADVPRLSDRAAVKLDNFAKAGGTVVLLPGNATDVGALARLDFLPATALRLRDLPNGRLSSEIIDPGNPLFANTWGPGTPFPPLPQHRLIEWKSRANLQMLVTAGGTEGFVMGCDDGAGKVYLVNASPDRAWGDFPLSPAFLPLMQQIALQSSERGTGGNRSFTVGEPVPPSPALPRDQPLTITAPDGTTQNMTLGEKGLLLEHAAQSGFYQVGTLTDPALLAFAVNVDTKESDLTPIAEDALTRITPHESVPGPDELRRWLTQSRGMVPLWPALLGLLALAFVAESVLSNLAAKHRSQGDDTHIQTGRLHRRRVGSSFRPAGVEAVEPEKAAASPSLEEVG